MNWLAPDRKVRPYLLNAEHPEGGPKAKFFFAHGFSVARWHVLKAALEQHPVDNGIFAGEANDWGQKLIVVCNMQTPDGTNPCVKTIWQLEVGAPARLITAYPAR